MCVCARACVCVCVCLSFRGVELFDYHWADVDEM